MSEKEVFATPCWNFIGGDRQIEGILRDLPPRSPLVVRNRLANVLATVAGLADLGRLRWTDPLPLAVRVPDNAIGQPGGGLDDVYPAAEFYRVMASRLYGIGLAGERDEVMPRSLVIATGYTTAHEPLAARLAAWLVRQSEVALILLIAPGAQLARPLRPFAQTAWSTQHWDGLNAFSLPTLEEAVAEFAPTQIRVAAAHAATAAHTAVGAVDYFVRQAAEAGDAHVDPFACGRHVALLDFAIGQGLVGQGPPATLRALVKRHLEEELGVESTAPDPRFQVTSEAIAIDLV